MSESEMYLVDLNDAIVATQIFLGSGTVFTMPHECENPEHSKEQLVRCLVLSVQDVKQVKHTIVVPADSPLAAAFQEMDIYYEIKHILENIDN